MMKKYSMLLAILFLLLLVGCRGSEGAIQNGGEASSDEMREYELFTFEAAVREFATHFVVVQYVESRPFGDYYIEFEFVVIDEIRGTTTERIFVFLQHTPYEDYNRYDFIHGHLSFESGVNYLLPLSIFRDSVHSTVQRDGDQFVFISKIVINLDDPLESVMHGRPLDGQIEGFELSAETSSDEILDYVPGLFMAGFGRN